VRRTAGIALLLLGLAAPPGAPGGPLTVTRYLVDGRIHVAVIARPDRSGGEVTWLDTVTGRRGDAPFSRQGACLHLTAAGRPSRAYVLGNFALVVETPPWDAGRGSVLGVAVD